jgi:integrase
MPRRDRDSATPVATQTATDDLSTMFLVLRGTTYHFRRKVPPAIRHLIQKREVTKSLKTSDKATAFLRAAPLVKQTSIDFAKAQAIARADRAKSAGQKRVQVRKFENLSEEQIKGFCDQFLANRLAESEALAELLDDDDHRDNAYDHLCHEIEAFGPGIAEASARGRNESYDHALPVFLREQGIELSDDFPLDRLKKLKRAFVQTNAKWFELKKDLRDGKAPETRQVALPTVEPFSVRDALNIWLSLGNRNEKTSVEMRRLAEEFSSHYDGDLRLLDKRTAIAFFSAKSTHRTRATLKKQHGLLRALCSASVDADLLQNNPFAGLKIKFGLDSIVKEGLNTSEIKAVFSSDLLAKNEEIDFLCTLSLITGARIEELCQLTKSDFRRDGGIRFISINRETEKSTKNLQSIRNVPLHPNFVQYIERYLTSRETVFSFPASTYGKRSTAVDKRINRLIRHKLKMPTTKTFHSIRHTFKTLGRDAGIEKEISDCLTGHIGENDASRNYGEYSLETLYRAVSKLKFPIVRPSPN